MDQKEKERLFGEIAVDLGFIEHPEIDHALAEQRSHEGTSDRRQIGEYLLEKGLLTQAQIDEVLEIQGKVVRSARSMHDN